MLRRTHYLMREFIASTIAGVALGGARASQEQSQANSSAPALGPIRLSVDASRAPQKILHAHLQIPVQPGPLTLYYPEWIPGEHMPDGPIINVAGLKFVAGGKASSVAPRPARWIHVSPGYSAGRKFSGRGPGFPAFRARHGLFGRRICDRKS